MIDEAGKDKPRLTFAQAQQLLSANQIEALLGCIPAGSTRPAAEHDLLALMRTIDGFGLDKPVANDLGNHARQAGQQIADRRRQGTPATSSSELSKKIADLKKKGKLTAAQAATLDDAVADIAREVGC